MKAKAALRAALGAAFASEFVICDLALRGRDALATPRALIGVLGSLALWGAALGGARRRVPRALIGFFASFLLLTQLVFFRHYHSFLDLDAALAARQSWPDVRAIVRELLPTTIALASTLTIGQWLLLSVASKPKPRQALSLGAVALAATLFAPLGQHAPPDLGALSSLRALVTPREARAAGRVNVPHLPSKLEQLPNVLLILTESVRASDYCGDAGSPCPTAPETAALLPNRIALHQLRSLASYTAISANALLSGRMPLGSRDEIVSTPLLFDYLHRVHSGQTRPRVLFWSAQADSLFERTDVSAATDSYVTVEKLVGHPIDDLEDVLDQRVDELLARQVQAELPRVKPPFFLMLQLCGTHAPYFVDTEHAPFRPYTRAASFTGLDELHNAYRDAILAQDASVAKMLETFLSRVGSEPWLVIFTSDHGEAFGEHKAIHHGQNLYDEQIHVPGFVAFGNGALTPEQRSALASHADDFVTELDVLPTLLDAYGVLDSFELEPYRARFLGQSWLRPFSHAPTPVAGTNCTPLFPCPLRNWGVIAGRYGLVSQAWDGGWRCVDYAGPALIPNGEAPECDALRRASKSLWPALPNGRRNE